jgi:hypothetical protein
LLVLVQEISKGRILDCQTHPVILTGHPAATSSKEKSKAGLELAKEC